MEKLDARADRNDGSKLAVSTVDELMRDHVDFLDTCLKECMLANSKLLKVCFRISGCYQKLLMI